MRLSEPAEKLAVGEGIETCLSVLQVSGRAVWAALSTSGMKALELPEIVCEITVIADADEAGEEAALFAGRRWREVRARSYRQDRSTKSQAALTSTTCFSGREARHERRIKNAMDNANVVPDDVIAKLLKIDNLIDRELKIKEEAERLRGLLRNHQGGMQASAEGSRFERFGDAVPLGCRAVAQRVDPGELFRRIKDHLRLHVVMSEHSAIATALWVMFAWVHAAAVHSRFSW